MTTNNFHQINLNKQTNYLYRKYSSSITYMPNIELKIYLKNPCPRDFNCHFDQSKLMEFPLLSLNNQFSSISQSCPILCNPKISHPYMTTGKTITLTRWNFVGKVMSLLLSMLSRLVIAFLPRSKHLLISWLQSPSVIFEIASKYYIVDSFVDYDGCFISSMVFLSTLVDIMVI